MSITFECNACGADYDLEIPAIVDRPNSLKCPNCGAHPPAHRAHAFATALEDLLAAMAAIRKKVRFEIALETDEMPPPYGAYEEEDTGFDPEAEDAVEEDEDEEPEEEEPADAPAARRTPAAKPAAAKKGAEDEDEDEDDDFDDDDEDDDLDDLDGLDDEDEDEDDDEDDDEEDEDDEEEEEEEEKPKPKPPTRKKR